MPCPHRDVVPHHDDIGGKFLGRCRRQTSSQNDGAYHPDKPRLGGYQYSIRDGHHFRNPAEDADV
jgi:hypothetical protein